MALTLPYTALITTEELERAAISSLSLDRTLAADTDIMIDVIIDVTARIESWLNRTLIVRNVTQRVREREWEYDDVAENYVAYARQWPAVQAITSGLTFEDASPGDQQMLEYASADDVRLNYFAGYKRRDQVVASDLDEETSLSALTVTPTDLPGDIRDVCVRLCLERLFKAENKLFGTGISRQMVGGGQVAGAEVYVGIARDFEERQLKRLMRYRLL